MSAEPMGVLVARIHAGDMAAVPERPQPAQVIDLAARRRRLNPEQLELPGVGS